MQELGSDHRIFLVAHHRRYRIAALEATSQDLRPHLQPLPPPPWSPPMPPGPAALWQTACYGCCSPSFVPAVFAPPSFTASC